MDIDVLLHAFRRASSQPARPKFTPPHELKYLLFPVFLTSTSDYDSLRRLQQHTNAVITGEVALQFFGCLPIHSTREMRLVVTREHLEAVAEWLISVGYSRTTGYFRYRHRTLSTVISLKVPEHTFMSAVLSVSCSKQPF